VSWNASVWDFADQYGVPSYNFKGAVGVAFFRPPRVLSRSERLGRRRAEGVEMTAAGPVKSC
jgi:hypothetical protein